MTREKYLKYREIIDWFYTQPNGAKVWCKENNNTWFLTDDPKWFVHNKYVINDEYAELRKAIAEGKTIQHLEEVISPYGVVQDRSGIKEKWVDTVLSPNFTLKIDIKKYRVKPEEYELKENDFIRTKDGKIDKIAFITNDNIYSKDRVYKKEDIALWEPEQEEKVWIWNNECDYPYIATFLSMNENKYNIKEIICGNSYWDNCEPFIGELPSISR